MATVFICDNISLLAEEEGTVSLVLSLVVCVDMEFGFILTVGEYVDKVSKEWHLDSETAVE